MKNKCSRVVGLLIFFVSSFHVCAQIKGETGYIYVDKDIRIFYQKVGTGNQTVVVPLHLYLFEDFKHLAKGKTFIFYDVRNRGQSDAVADGSKLSIQDDVRDLEKLRQHFKLRKMSLIGESYIGLMVVMYSIQYPQYVERLIQIGAAPLKLGTKYPKEFLPNDEKPVLDSSEIAKIDELRTKDYHKTNPREYCEKEWAANRIGLVGNPANAEKVRSPCSLPNEWFLPLERHWEFHFVSFQKLDIPKSEVAKVTVPVLTIHGTKDRTAVYGAGREWATILPNARLLTVNGAGHVPWVDEPELVFTAIETFLSGKFPKIAEKLN